MDPTEATTSLSASRSEWTHPSAYVGATNINGDGRLDVVLSPSELAGQTYRIAWYAAPTDPTSGDWAEQVIEADVEAVHHYVGAADFDNDGEVDIASAEMHQGSDPDEVKIFVNGGGGASWNKVVLATSGSHSNLHPVADDDIKVDEAVSAEHTVRRSTPARICTLAQICVPSPVTTSSSI